MAKRFRPHILEGGDTILTHYGPISRLSRGDHMMTNRSWLKSYDNADRCA